jgi:osmotically-inducible protein OsmY/sporulation protein YlmC with PRC-barrel domain
MENARYMTINRVIGMPVRNPEGERIGHIEDLILEPAGTRDSVAVVGLGGLEGKWFLVPWKAMQFAQDGESLIVHATRERIERGPVLDPSQPLPQDERDWKEAVDSYYGLEQDRRAGREPFPRRTFSPAPRSRSRVFPILTIAVVLVAGALVYTMFTENWPTSPGSVRQAAAAVKEASENAATTARVKAALALSKRVSAFSVNVDTDNDAVTLQGRVQSEEVKRLAGDIASDAAGDKLVRNQLIVDEETQPHTESDDLVQRVVDLEIRADVDTALRSDPDLEGTNIRVDVKRRQVTLEGAVQRETQRLRAEEHARSVEWVIGVDNRLRVSNRGS